MPAPDHRIGLRIAISHLRHNAARTLVAIAGVAFPAVLILVQLGILAAVLRTATLTFDELDFDIALTSPDYRFITRPDGIDRASLYQAKSVDGVAGASPLYVAWTYWLNPADGSRRQLMLLGIDPRDNPFTDAEIRAAVDGLKRRDKVLVDRMTRPEYGPIETGMIGELGLNRVEVIGRYTIGPGFAAFGAALTDDQTFVRSVPGSSLQRVSLAFVRLEPGAAIGQVVTALRQRLPASVRVMTRAELAALERSYWEDSTSIGIIMTWGVVVAFGVAGFVFYQLLSTDIANNLTEYATLKAMGYGRQTLNVVVLAEGAVLCVAGYLPAVAMAAVLYRLTASAARVPMELTLSRVVLVFGFLALAALAAGLMATRRLELADPAELF